MAGISDTARPGRRVRYGVAMSLDGYIAGPNGEYDWITQDPEVDFAEIFSHFDTLLIGRKTFEAMLTMGGGGGSWPGVKSFVISRTLKQADDADVTIATDAGAIVTNLKAEPGKDIWLFGGGGFVQESAGRWTRGRRRHGDRPCVAWRRGSADTVTGAANTTHAHEAAGVHAKSGIVRLESDVVH